MTEALPQGEQHSTRSGRETWLARLSVWLLMAGLVLFHGVNNWIWLVQNVTSTGWDKPRHLAQSLSYTQMLAPITVRSLFEVMVSDPIRTPLVPASAAIMYWLFGRTADIATMVNMIYMVIVLAATYGLGQRWGGRRLGLVSVLLLACFPMFYAMSRYFYLEFALMAMVTMAVYLLLVTDGFRRRGVSLLFGLSLGLGLLTKRTFLLFIVGPAIVAVLASGLLPELWRRLRQRPRLYWKNALLALGGGLVLAAIWYLPNRETVQSLILGDALFFLWWVLAALAIYFSTLSSAPLSNALSAFFLAAGLASTWYLGRIEFLERVAIYGWGLGDPRGRVLRLDSLDTYLYYLRKLANEHLSPVLFVVLMAVLVVAVVVVLRQRRSVRQALRQVKVEGWAILAWVGGAYVVLTLSIYHETRALTPVLPAVALIFGAALLKLPWRRIRWGVLALVLAFGVVQFFVLSHESINRLLPPKTLVLPFWGRTSLFAQGVDIQLPDEGQTDRGYWIHPDVLQRMEQRRLALGRESLSVGLLVNTSQINAGSLNYLILTEYPHLRVDSLINGVEESGLYHHLFADDFVAIKRSNASTSPSQEEIIEAILDGPPRLFSQAFELEATYSLPDSDTVYLYRRRYNLPADYPVEYVASLAAQLGDRTQVGDAILLTPPELVGPFVSHYTGPAEIYLAPFVGDELVEIAAQHRRVFLVQGDAEAGEVQDLPRDWLSRHGFWSTHEWADSLQLIVFGTVAGSPAVTPTVEVHAQFGDQIELVGYDLPATVWQPDDIVPLTLFWQGQAAIGEDYHVFVHLLDSGGQLVAQTDSAPAGGSRPTSSWGGEGTIPDRHGLLLPDTLPAGEYELRVGMYLPATGDRVPLLGEDGQVRDDSILLDSLTVSLP
jgi:4-amino-4-deoxy-L-arabinose transferase-like glycosyltransferase